MRLNGILGSVLTVLTLALPAAAQTPGAAPTVHAPARHDGGEPASPAAPATLEQHAAAIELASKEPDGDRVVVGHISRKLRLPVETLRTQRAQTGLGWGEVLIANRLAAGARLPFDQVVAEFRGGEAWEQIARNHGVNVNTLLTDVQESQRLVEQRAEDKAPSAGTVNVPSSGAGRPGGAARPGRSRY